MTLKEKLKDPKPLTKLHKKVWLNEVRDPRTHSRYVPVPKEGVLAGWATDRMSVVKEGWLIGFEFPLEQPPNQGVDLIGRVLSLATRGGAGETLDPVHINVIVWGPELGHCYQRFVHPQMVRWTREPGLLLDSWFFTPRSSEFTFDNQEIILRTLNWGSITDNAAKQWIGTPMIEEGAFLMQPSSFPCWHSHWIKYDSGDKIINGRERALESFLYHQRQWNPEDLNEERSATTLAGEYMKLLEENPDLIHGESVEAWGIDIMRHANTLDDWSRE